MNVLGRVGRIRRRVPQRLDADVVDRFLERAGAAGLDRRRRIALAAVPAHHVEAVGLAHVEIRVSHVGHGTRLDQRDGDGFLRPGTADRQRHVVELDGEAELERDVFDRVAVVVDVDLVQGVRIHREVVGAAIRPLQRLVVGDQRHVVAAASTAVRRHALVAAEHVEIRRVDLGAGRDEGRLAVARCEAGRRSAGRASSQQRELEDPGSFRAHVALLGRLDGLERPPSTRGACEMDSPGPPGRANRMDMKGR